MTSVTGTLHPLLEGVFKNYSSLTIDYTITVAERGLTTDLRTANYDVNGNPQNQGHSPYSYDIIIDVHALGFSDVLERSLGQIRELLAPGGFLIVLEVNGADKVAGGQWIDHVFSPQGSWPGISLGKKHHRWSPAMWYENLSKASLKPLGDSKDDSNLFITISSQKPSLPIVSPSAAPAVAKKPLIFSFSLSNALDLQDVLAAATSEGHSAVWIESTYDTADGSGAMGFTRSLRKEIVQVDINLVLFDSNWNADSKVSIIQQLASFPYLETEVAIDKAGVVLVPRLLNYPSKAPASLDSDKYWVLEGADNVIHPALPIPAAREVLIKVSRVTEAGGELQGVVGTVHRAGSSQWSVGARVVAVAETSASNFVVVHEGQVAEAPKGIEDDAAAALALPLVLAAFAVQASGPSETSPESQVIVLDTGSLSQDVTQALQVLGYKPLLIPSSLPVTLPPLSAGDVIAFGLSAASTRALQPALSGAKGVRLFNWDDATRGALSSLLQNPSFAGNVLRKYFKKGLSAASKKLTTQPSAAALPKSFSVSPYVTFKDDAFYLIVGGIGSLGLNTAIWMYEVRIQLDFRCG